MGTHNELLDSILWTCTRPDHGPVRTVGSDRNRGQKTEIGIGFTISEPESGSESVNIRFRFGLRKSKSWIEPTVHGSLEVREVQWRFGRFKRFGRFNDGLRFNGGSRAVRSKKIFFLTIFFSKKKNWTWTVQTGPEPSETAIWIV